MELTYDWRSFQSVFYPQKRALSVPSSSRSPSAVFAVVEKDRVVVAYAEGESLSDYIGVSLEGLRSALGGREIIAFEREQIDQWVSGAVALPHLHRQLDQLRQCMGQNIRRRGSGEAQAPLEDSHFLLDAILGRWSKVLPSTFGVFIRLEKAPAGHEIDPILFESLGGRCREYLDREQDILILVRGGKLEAFYEPDLSPMGAERRHLCGEVVKYLSDKHLVAIQGLTLPFIDWIALSHANRPWRQFAGALKSRSAKMYPLRWRLTALLGLRAAVD